jgi:uncharacterized protein (TIGR03032 family)
VSNETGTQIHVSEGLWSWLSSQALSLAFTTYQTNRLFLVGCKDNERISINERVFDRPMGLFGKGDSLFMACRYQLWQLTNMLPAGSHYQGSDRLYKPAVSHITGDLNVHDLVVDDSGRLLFINTDFSCLATLHPDYSFAPLWQPPFISRLAPEDRCHLNGLAMQNGIPTYATACSQTDQGAGWRNHRLDGGVVVHIPSNSIAASGLSMPHSPRCYRGKLWVLNSGTGEFGYIDGDRFMPVCFCPGFVRGLAFHGDYAIVGLSKLRSRTFTGLTLEERLHHQQAAAQCGLHIIDLLTGKVVHRLTIEGPVEELFDIVVLPGVRQPKAVGFQSEDIQRLITYPGSDKVIITKPIVKKSRAANLPLPGNAGESNAAPPIGEGSIKFQQIFHLTPESLAPYDSMTSPSLLARWQLQPQRGELLGFSAAVDGSLIGMAVAERIPAAVTQANLSRAALISLCVVPEYHHRGVAAMLVQQLQKLVNQILVLDTAESTTEYCSKANGDLNALLAAFQ